MAAVSDATLQATTRTPHAPWLLAIALPVVMLAAKGVTLPPHPMVVLAGPRILLLVLVEKILENGLAWTWRFLLRGLRSKMQRLPLIPYFFLLLMMARLFPACPPILEMIGVSMIKMILLPWLALLW